MDDGRLKQRLVGAVVLVALGVIFIPMMLSGGRDMEMPVFGSNVPERTQEIKNIKHLDIDVNKTEEKEAVNIKRLPVAKDLPEPKIVEEEKTIVETIKEATSTEEAAKQTDKTVWAVQVGSFSKKTNALRLKERLRKKQIHAFVERLVTNNAAVYRVRVGPQVSEENAQKMKQRLEKEFGIKGLVVRHP